jgi:hypothetical protein
MNLNPLLMLIWLAELCIDLIDWMIIMMVKMELMVRDWVQVLVSCLIIRSVVKVIVVLSTKS